MNATFAAGRLLGVWERFEAASKEFESSKDALMAETNAIRRALDDGTMVGKATPLLDLIERIREKLG